MLGVAPARAASSKDGQTKEVSENLAWARKLLFDGHSCKFSSKTLEASSDGNSDRKYGRDVLKLGEAVTQVD